MFYAYGLVVMAKNEVSPTISVVYTSYTGTGAANRAKPNDFWPFSSYRAKLFTRVILGPAQRNYIEKGTLPPKSAPQNKIGLKFLLQKVEIFRRQPSPVSIGLSPICSPRTRDYANYTHFYDMADPTSIKE